MSFHINDLDLKFRAISRLTLTYAKPDFDYTKYQNIQQPPPNNCNGNDTDSNCLIVLPLNLGIHA